MPALIGLAYYSLFALSVLDNFRGPFYPEILQDLGLGPAAGSLFFATMSLFAFLGSWSLHGVLRRWSAVHLLTFTSLLLVVGFGGMAAAPTFPLLLTGCSVFGLGFGGINLAQNVLIGEAADGALRRRLFSGLHAMYGLASLTAPLMATWFRQQSLSWRIAFAVATIFPLTLALWSWRFQARNNRSLAKTNPHADDSLMVAPLTRAEWWHCAGFGLLLAGYLWGELSISSRLVLWLRSERAFAPDQADNYLAGFFAFLMAGRLLFGVLHFERVSNWLLLALSAAASATLYALGLWNCPVFLMVSGLTMAPFYPIMMDQVSRHFGKRSSQPLGFVIGAASGSVVLMHLVIGQINQWAGLTAALSVCAGSLALVSVALFVRTIR